MFTNVNNSYFPAGVSAGREVKSERSEAETQDLKNQFLLAVNGYHIGAVEDSNLTKINEYSVQGDGVYIIVKNKIGKFVQKVIDYNFPGLPKQFNGDKVFLSVPRIPSSIYYQIKAWFTDICTDMGDNEAFCQVYLDTQTNRYLVHVPKQKVSKASVVYDAEDTPATEDDPSDRYILVYECHSHNSMGAFWSGTDNADEKNTRFYGVFGELNKDDYAEKHRYIIMGKEVPITREGIFDFSKEKSVSKNELQSLLNDKNSDLIDKAKIYELLNKKADKVEYPKEWTDQIELPKTYGGYAGYGGYYNRSNPLYSGQEGNPNAPVNTHGADKKNTDGVGKQTSLYSSRQKHKEWAEKYHWDDDYDNYGFGEDSLAITHQKEKEEVDEISESAWLESVYDSFSLTDIESDEDAMEAALSSVAESIPTMYVPDLMDKLIDQGHEMTLKGFWKQ